MLRASAAIHDLPLDIRAVQGSGVESGVPGGAELVALVDAIVLRDDHEVEAARDGVVDRLGTQSAVRVAAVTGNFEMMNRLLDGAGVPLTEEVRAAASGFGLTKA